MLDASRFSASEGRKKKGGGRKKNKLQPGEIWLIGTASTGKSRLIVAISRSQRLFGSEKPKSNERNFFPRLSPFFFSLFPPAPPPTTAGQRPDPRGAADPSGAQLHPDQSPGVQPARRHAPGGQLHLRPALPARDLPPARPRLPQLPGAALQGGRATGLTLESTAV